MKVSHETPPRVALVGLKLESNRFSRPADMQDFTSLTWLEGNALLAEARKPNPALATEFAAFVRAMDASGQWVPVPILLAASHPLGPVKENVFEDFCNFVFSKLGSQIDAVYLCQHGAMVAEHLDDPDGELVKRLRKKLGSNVPLVMTLDLHANISDDLCNSANFICGYRTNPHVDMAERGRETAFALRCILAGQVEPKIAHVKLPLAPSSIALLTASGPYGQLIDFGQRRQAEFAGAIMNVSVFGNFIFSDVPENGVSIVVTAAEDYQKALHLANEIAQMAWNKRQEFIRDLTPLSDAIAQIQEQTRKPLIFSEAGDNPGGGGSGRATAFLSALISASACNVLYGSFFDPALATDAHKAGIGSEFIAKFNQNKGSAPWEAWDVALEVKAKVIAISDGHVVGRLGMFAGRQLHLGSSALLQIDGIKVVVISDRAQTADPIFFEMFGENIATAHSVIVKSRGHFRAGFAPWFSDTQTVEVDTGGLTSPVLDRFSFSYIRRPSFPFDRDTKWIP
jgi:microcystin degradation protein MlrC